MVKIIYMTSLKEVMKQMKTEQIDKKQLRWWPRNAVLPASSAHR